MSATITSTDLLLPLELNLTSSSCLGSRVLGRITEGVGTLRSGTQPYPSGHCSYWKLTVGDSLLPATYEKKSSRRISSRLPLLSPKTPVQETSLSNGQLSRNLSGDVSLRSTPVSKIDLEVELYVKNFEFPCRKRK